MIGSMYAGEDKIIGLAFSDLIDSDPVSIVGYGITVRIEMGDFGEFSKTVGSGVTIVSGTGEAYVTLSAADTAPVTEQVNADFVVTLVAPDGFVSKPIVDKLIIKVEP